MSESIYMMIDVDTHITEPRDLWTSRVPAKWKDRVPRAEFNRLLDKIGTDRILFETDFPRPTCLYGNIQETIEKGLGDVAPDVRHRILFENAAELYRIEKPY